MTNRADTGGDVTSPHHAGVSSRAPKGANSTPAAATTAAGAFSRNGGHNKGQFTKGSASDILQRHTTVVVQMRANGGGWKEIARAIGFKGEFNALQLAWARSFSALSPRRRTIHDLEPVCMAMRAKGLSWDEIAAIVGRKSRVLSNEASRKGWIKRAREAAR